jgi:Holliday junction resolvasome RuvABC endonuclease subunit
MIILGIRCSTNDFSYAIVTGNQASPNIIESGNIKFPSGYNDSDRIRWFYQETGELISKFSIKGIGIKGVEPMAMKGKAYGERMQIEGILFLLAAENSIKYIKRKVKGTIAKDFGLKGRGKYLATQFDYSNIPDFNKKSPNIQESIQVALSMLK